MAADSWPVGFSNCFLGDEVSFFFLFGPYCPFVQLGCERHADGFFLFCGVQKKTVRMKRCIYTVYKCILKGLHGFLFNSFLRNVLLYRFFRSAIRCFH